MRSQLRMRECDGVYCAVEDAVAASLRWWRTVRPLLAGSGLVPASAAKAGPSLRTRPGDEAPHTFSPYDG